VSELGSCKEVSAGPGFQFHRAPRGPRMRCGWACGASSPGARCARASTAWPAGSPHRGDRRGRNRTQVRTPTWAASAVRLALRSPTRGEPAAGVFYSKLGGRGPESCCVPQVMVREESRIPPSGSGPSNLEFLSRTYSRFFEKWDIRARDLDARFRRRTT
jgi:hypothetical protein